MIIDVRKLKEIAEIEFGDIVEDVIITVTKEELIEELFKK